MSTAEKNNKFTVSSIEVISQNTLKTKDVIINWSNEKRALAEVDAYAKKLL